MPLVRLMKSVQSLKGAFWRSLMIFPDIAGPTPLMLSSSASVALLTSTAAAKATPAKAMALNKTKKVRNFLNMINPQVNVRGLRMGLIIPYQEGIADAVQPMSSTAGKVAWDDVGVSSRLAGGLTLQV